ncbi:hybrid sensor histidine kinase/response regulator [Thiorhodovibrio frisius]|uniref:histidine kinase n=1 Tax=Thiorhodovibrio frisius TaxID=631362 RepID=H8Z0P3_9GAMM|nr:ATP-binding protein [Thiorhodovibrio frisius]EIC22384.1 PAS domain S-box [Thiorhodovibrio frisius]WPL24682.1 Virulence sensor protein BvgS precursor [Thiorhodovibrio frisius]
MTKITNFKPETLAADNRALNRLNQALQDKVRELESVNNDLNNLLLSSEVATLFLDPELRLRRFTPASDALFDLGPTAIGRPVSDLQARFDSAGLLADACAVLAGQSPAAREVATDNGRWFSLRLRPYRTPSEPIAGVVASFSDCTASRLAEQRYRETLGRLKRHMDNSPVASMEWDIKGRLLGWSPAAERILGWNEQAVIGQTLEELCLVHAADRDHMRSVREALFRGEFEHNRIPVRNRRADGRMIWCEWYNSALHDSAGQLVSILSLVVDVTERQALEDNLRNTTARLAEADRRKNAFLALLGHELRNPLAPVRSTLDALALTPQPDSSTYKQAVCRIDRQMRHLERLVQDLLDAARINRSAIVLRRQSEDLAALARETVEALANPLAERAHRLELELPNDPVWVQGDATRLVQVLTNLLDNAIKYTEPGGQIHLSLNCQDGQVCLSITDTGQGIAAEDQHWLFDAFTRGAEDRVGRESGLGIGLALVRQLVELHQGRVEAHSAGVGCGATFNVWLPVAEVASDAPNGTEPPESQRDTAPELSGQPALRARRVMVVDDEPEILEATAVLLRALGHQVQTAATGAEALERIGTDAPEIVFLDVGLPDMDGLELARHLANWPQRRGLRLVAVSGYSLVEQPEATELFDDQLLKPAGRQDFERVLAVE